MKTVTELWDEKPIIEVDDYAVGFMMVEDIRASAPEFRAKYLAQWAARLREYYVEVGKQLILTKR